MYRAVASPGQTIDFLLTAKRDAAAAKRFFRKVFCSSAHPIPRAINVDKNAAYPAAVAALKKRGILPRRVRLRQGKYLHNVIEQDHRVSKKRVWLAKGYKAFASARRTLEGMETMHRIRQGRVRRVARKTWWPKQDLWPTCSASLTRSRFLSAQSPALRSSIQNFATKSLFLAKDTPEPRPVQPPEQGCVISLPQVGGLHPRYERRAA